MKKGSAVPRMSVARAAVGVAAAAAVGGASAASLAPSDPSITAAPVLQGAETRKKGCLGCQTPLPAFVSDVRGGATGGTGDENANVFRQAEGSESASAASAAPAEETAGEDVPSSTRRGGGNKSATPEIIHEILQEEDYYAILGVDRRTATSAHIKKAYRRRAVQTHPDKVPGGDRRAFDRVAEAYDVLSNEEKKTVYDRFGKAGLESGAGAGFGGSFQDDILRTFFGGNVPPGFAQRAQGGRRPAPRNRDIRYQLDVSLEELYKGVKRTVVIGDRNAAGRRGASSQRKEVEVVVSPGMASGQTLRFPGEVDYVADAAPADLIFVLAQRRHPVFTRRGHDLAMELKISLKEALCGVSRAIRRLDGRPILLKTQHVPGVVGAMKDRLKKTKEKPTKGFDASVISTGDVYVLKGEGMPKGGAGNGHGGKRGDLYVQFEVEMPSGSKQAKAALTEAEREELGRLLDKLEGNTSAKPPKMENDNKTPVGVLSPASVSDFGRASGPFTAADEDGEEEHLKSDDEERFGPFGRGSGFQYFGGDGTFFGGQSFGGMPFGNAAGDDGSNVQCQQM